MTTKELELILQETYDIHEFISLYESELKVEPFYEFALNKISEAQLKLSEVLIKSHISKSTGYKIMKGERMPSRDIILRLSIGIGLNVTDTNRILKLSNKSPLDIMNPRDNVIMFALNKKYDLIETEKLIDDLKLKSLDGKLE